MIKKAQGSEEAPTHQKWLTLAENGQQLHFRGHGLEYAVKWARYWGQSTKD